MTGVKIVWTEPARQDLRDFFTCIAEDNPDAAQTPLTKIKEGAVLLQDNPNLGRIGRFDGTRELVLPGTHYILPYRLKEQQSQLVAGFHAARQ